MTTCQHSEWFSALRVVVAAELRVGAYGLCLALGINRQAGAPPASGRHAARLVVALQAAGRARWGVLACDNRGRCACHEDHHGQDEDSGDGAAHGGRLKASAWLVGVLGVSLH